MSLFKSFDIAASGVTAQGRRLNATASNLANADSAAGADGQAYKARQVMFQAVPVPKDPGAAGVKVQKVVESAAEPRRVHDPKHPMAGTDGYVTMANVNVAEEMVNMVSAARSYQSNLEVMNTAKTLMLKTLTMGN